MAADPGGAVLIHLGNSYFLRRYKTYLAHLQEWRQQFQKLDSVDLRYERQIIVNPDSSLHAASPHPALAAPHPAVAAKPMAVAKPVATAQVKKPAPARKPSPRTAKTSSGTQ